MVSDKLDAVSFVWIFAWGGVHSLPRGAAHVEEVGAAEGADEWAGAGVRPPRATHPFMQVQHVRHLLQPTRLVVMIVVLDQWAARARRARGFRSVDSPCMARQGSGGSDGGYKIS
jgi:hypothetical protein